MSKKILIIDGHPDPESYCNALASAYEKGAKSGGHDVQTIRIRDLEFTPNLEFGYRKRTELEPDLLQAQEQLKWADHLVWVYPVWWGSVPAIMKGFLDRVLLPGFAFKKREGSVWWDKELTGRTGRLISTMDQPNWYYRLINGRPSHIMMKRMTLQFIGIKKVGITPVAPIRLSKESFRTNWLKKIEALGKQGK